MKQTRCFCLALGLALINLQAVFGQPTREGAAPVHYWAYAGPAATTLGPGATAGLAVAFDRHVLSVRGVSTDLAPGKETWRALFCTDVPLGEATFSPRPERASRWSAGLGTPGCLAEGRGRSSAR